MKSLRVCAYTGYTTSSLFWFHARLMAFSLIITKLFLVRRGGVGWKELDAEGTYQCSLTGLIFEVTEAVKITYSLLSWSKYANLVEKPWIVGGPLFDVHCDSSRALTSIQFPHSLYHGADMAFKVLHIKGEGAAIEPSADYSASHVKWLVSSLSPVGPLIQSQEPVQYHGAVILYKVVDQHPSLSFRVYVATNNDSFIKVWLASGGLCRVA
uniref:FIIND domain-containing protein n=1 Tax=Calidris pygmaea TaxID=425635 RepID=A0A8C3J630_9CHAR